MGQVVGDHYRAAAETGGVLCLRCHHLELVGGGQAKLQSYERIASQDPASLHCGWEVTSLPPPPVMPSKVEPPCSGSHAPLLFLLAMQLKYKDQGYLPSGG